MKIVIPSQDKKLCGHFGHCEYFTLAEVNDDSKEIMKIEEFIPEGGVSCQSAGLIAEQGVDVVLAGGMGGRPLQVFAQNGIKVITGCPEKDVREVISEFLSGSLCVGENSCGGGHHHCHGHGESGGCHGHHH